MTDCKFTPMDCVDVSEPPVLKPSKTETGTFAVDIELSADVLEHMRRIKQAEADLVEFTREEHVFGSYRQKELARFIANQLKEAEAFSKAA